MQEHEAWIRRPAKELFPDIGKPAKPRFGVCEGCGKEFRVVTRGGPNQKWCTSRCRITTQRSRRKSEGGWK